MVRGRHNDIAVLHAKHRDATLWVSCLRLEFHIHWFFRPASQHPEGPLPTFATFRAHSEASAQVSHAQTGGPAGQSTDIAFPNTFADTDVHAWIPNSPLVT